MATVKVIDVSHHQGEINWEKVKVAGVRGAIIRVSDSTGTMDRQYDRNVSECTRLGIPFGLYIYSRAKDAAKLQGEIDLILSRANRCNKSVLLYPLYIDLEAYGCEGYANTAANEFKKQIEAAGYYAGVYANKNWFDNYVGSTGNMTRWAARYNSELGMNGIDMWQYTSSGSVDGISGSVDMNHCYRDFPSEIRDFYASNGSSFDSSESAASPSGSTLDLVVGVMQGKYGNGDARKTALGARHDEVQTVINHISSASASTLAAEVLEGRYGNGDTRKIALGSRYNEVQNIVNQKSGTGYYPAFSNVSIVDGLNSIGVDSSKAHRKKIAAANGISNYSGTASQNNQLCALAKKGRLKKS